MRRLGVAAITPSVFTAALSDAERRALSLLESRLRNDLVVRDLGGDWLRRVSKLARKDAEILLSALKPLGRIVHEPSAGGRGRTDQHDDSEARWVGSARASHDASPLDACVRRDDGKPNLRDPEVQLVDFEGCPWRAFVDATASIERNEGALSRQIRPFLDYGKWLDIADPALDPSHSDYRYLDELIRDVAPSRRTPLLLTIHRPCLEGSQRKFVSNQEWETRFATWKDFGRKRVLVRVCVWSELHDRVVASNLGGLGLGNGIASSSRPSSKMVCSWMNQGQAEDALKTAVAGQKLRHCFTLPDGALEAFDGGVLGALRTGDSAR